MADINIDFPIGAEYKLDKEMREITREATLEVFNEVADFTVHLAKVIVRVDTGSLRKSIRKLRIGDVVKVVAGGSDIINPKSGKPVGTYALIVELKYPFLRPAWRVARMGLEEKVRQRIVEKARIRFEH